MSVTSVKLAAISAKSFGCCFYCGVNAQDIIKKKLHYKHKSHVIAEILLTLDHIVPESEGGRGLIENLILACPSCNSSKGNKSFNEFRLRFGRYWGEIMGCNPTGGITRTEIPWFKSNEQSTLSQRYSSTSPFGQPVFGEIISAKIERARNQVVPE